MGVIINADDFGLNDHCSLAIAEAFEKGLITDTTMVANGEYFDDAVALCKAKKFDDKIGIHFNLTEGRPLTDEINAFSSFVSDGKFHDRINRIRPISHIEKLAVYKELTAQIEKIIDTGIKITHADSHHHIHTGISIAPIVLRVCREHGINKIRLHRNIGSISLFKKVIKKAYNDFLHKKGFKTTKFFGSLEDIDSGGMRDNLEIMVHPDFDKSGVLIDRINEVAGYPVGKELTKTGENIMLMSYGEL